GFAFAHRGSTLRLAVGQGGDNTVATGQLTDDEGHRVWIIRRRGCGVRGSLGHRVDGFSHGCLLGCDSLRVKERGPWTDHGAGRGRGFGPGRRISFLWLGRAIGAWGGEFRAKVSRGSTRGMTGSRVFMAWTSQRCPPLAPLT